RKLNPDWIFMSGWGVMNQVAVKEAAAIGFKMDHFIGNWWSSSDADVVPAGDGAKGYKGATFHAPGTNFKVHSEIVKHVYDKGKGPVLIDEWDGKKWNIVSDWIQPMKDVVRPKIETAAVDEAKKLGYSQRDCGKEK